MRAMFAILGLVALGIAAGWYVVNQDFTRISHTAAISSTIMSATSTLSVSSPAFQSNGRYKRE